MPTPAKAATAATVPPKPAFSGSTATGKQRVAQAYASAQPSGPQSDGGPGFPRDGKLHGVALLAAYYAKHV